MPKFIRAFAINGVPAWVAEHKDRYSRLWFNFSDKTPDEPPESYCTVGLPKENIYSIAKMEQFPSCCGIGVIHELLLSNHLERLGFTFELLKESIIQNIHDAATRHVQREYFMAVTLEKNYDMWIDTFTALGGKVTKRLKNRNSGNINNVWEIPSL